MVGVLGAITSGEEGGHSARRGEDHRAVPNVGGRRCGWTRSGTIPVGTGRSVGFQMTGPDIISMLDVRFVASDGRMVPGRIWIGRPEIVDDVEARCSVGLDGLHERLHPISGTDTLQALLLAVRLLGKLLCDFEQKGGRVLLADGAPVDLRAYFGSLFDGASV